MPLSRQTIILVDDALSLANAQNEVRVDTDHVLAILAESTMSTSGLLRQHGITPKAIADMVADTSQVIRKDGTTQDFVAGAKSGKLKAVYFREDLLRDLINILTQAVNRHVILIGPDGVGKRTLAYSLALLMSEGKGPKQLKSLVQVDEGGAARQRSEGDPRRAEPGARRRAVHPASASLLRRSRQRRVLEIDAADPESVSGRRPGDHRHDHRTGIQPAARQRERGRREQPTAARAGAVG